MEFDAQMDEVKKGTRLCSLPDISIPSVPTAPALPVRARLLLKVMTSSSSSSSCSGSAAGMSSLASLWILTAFVHVYRQSDHERLCFLHRNMRYFWLVLYTFHIYNTWILQRETLFLTFHPWLFLWLFLNVEKFKHFNKCELSLHYKWTLRHRWAELLLKDRSFPYEDRGPSLPWLMGYF